MKSGVKVNPFEGNLLSEEEKLRLVKFLDALIEMDFEDGRKSKGSDSNQI